MTSLDDEIAADNPSGLWHLGNSGNPALDATANANDGVYTNASGYALSQPSLIAALPSSLSTKLIRANHGHVVVPDANSLDLGNTFTLEAWIKLNALDEGTDETIVSKQNGAYQLQLASDVVQLRRSQTATIRHANAALTTVGPHHVVATKAGATSVLYLDGAVLASTLDGDSTCANNANKLLIGSDGSTNTPDNATQFNGWIQYVAVYPTALSATRVLAHFLAGNVGLSESGADDSPDSSFFPFDT